MGFLDPMFAGGMSSLLSAYAPEAQAADSAPQGAPGHKYYIKNGKIYDSANVAVSADSVRAHMQRNDLAMKNNMKSAAVAPKVVEFANSDLAAQNAAMARLLEQIEGKK